MFAPIDSRLVLLLFISALVVSWIVSEFKEFTSKMSTCIYGYDVQNEFVKYVTFDINGDAKRVQMGKPCVFNMWNLSHVLLFAMFAFLFPTQGPFLFAAGVLWEVAESSTGHNNWLDIVWNAIGISIGITLARLRNTDAQNHSKETP
jgi:hypothetical protein